MGLSRVQFHCKLLLVCLTVALDCENVRGGPWDHCDDEHHGGETDRKPWSCERSREYERTMRATPSSCGIYLAPSGMEGAGFGLYATCEPKNGTVLSMSPAILFSFGDKPRAADRLVLRDYVWGADQYGATYEAPAAGKSLYSPGVGALTNSHPAHANVFKLASAEPLLDRRFDPGAGAFTDYFSSYVFATTIGDNHAFSDEEECLAEELLIHYGDAWFDERRAFRDLPRRDDYAEADRVVASFASVHATSVDAVTEATVNEFLQFSADVNVNPNAARILQGIASRGDLAQVLSSNGTARASAGLRRRSREWLDRHGHCQDRLYLAVSSIPQAGRGAFARRAVRKGDVILSSPLLPIFDWQQVLLDTQANDAGEQSNTTTHSLLLNYVFGHSNASAAFLPSTLLLAVNHASTRSGTNSPLEPNAKLFWATWSKKGTYYTRRPLDDLRQERSTTVVIDLVALRDLQPDEEVLIDYGEVWENHWDEHVRAWKPPCELDAEPCFKSSKVIWDMSLDKFNPLFHRWSDDHFTVCSLAKEDRQYIEDLATFPLGTSKAEGVPTPLRVVCSDDEAFGLVQKHVRSPIPCEIIHFDDIQGTFDVLLYSAEEDERGVHRVLRRHRHFPSERLLFRSKPYRSDMFFPGAFRHMISMPNDIFPEIWKGENA